MVLLMMVLQHCHALYLLLECILTFSKVKGKNPWAHLSLWPSRNDVMDYLCSARIINASNANRPLLVVTGLYSMQLRQAHQIKSIMWEFQAGQISQCKFSTKKKKRIENRKRGGLTILSVHPESQSFGQTASSNGVVQIRAHLGLLPYPLLYLLQVIFLVSAEFSPDFVGDYNVQRLWNPYRCRLLYLHDDKTS